MGKHCHAPYSFSMTAYFFLCQGQHHRLQHESRDADVEILNSCRYPFADHVRQLQHVRRTPSVVTSEHWLSSRHSCQTAHPWCSVRMRLMRVVFPDPRKPAQRQRHSR